MSTRRSLGLVVVALAAVLGAAALTERTEEPQALGGAAAASASLDGLAPTRHPPVPGRLEDMWLAPAAPAPAYAPLVEAARAVADQRHDEALRRLGEADLGGTPLAGYAAYYTGAAHLGRSDPAAARRVLSGLREGRPGGALGEAAALREAEAAEAEGDYADAVRIYRTLVLDRPSGPDEVWARLGRAALAAGNRAMAAEAFEHVYYDYPLSEQATEAARELNRLADVAAGLHAPSRFVANLARAQRLFDARRYSDARSLFVAIRAQAGAADRAAIDLRIAQCELHMRRYAAARDGTRPFVEDGPHVAEARYYHAAALRELGVAGHYQAWVRRLVAGQPDSRWTEEALDELATWEIRRSNDAAAAEVFREMLDLFPEGRRAERAIWRLGWWAYRRGEREETVRRFEHGAAAFPRSDYRPAWLYWAARSREALGQLTEAEALYQLAITDYGNLYHGRLAARRLPGVRDGLRAAGGRAGPPRDAGDRLPEGLTATRTGGGVVRHLGALAARPPNAPLVRELLAAGMWPEAIAELEYARRAGESTPLLEATIAYAYHRQGELRRAINLMRRTYPQFMASGGEALPPEILRVIFPLEYWDLIRKYSVAHDLDPFLVAALMAQESTFVPDIRSSANAIGLMQIIPPTGERLARALGISGYTTRMLTVPEINVRMGTYYFATLLRRFGAPHFALAGYNAGENRVVRWRAERPGVPADEFVDDIPFPETQNYVRRILGTAEDYRRLYGP